ncbi:MAG: DUF4340 domain-containing protein [Cyclobacteriaceae bacterium]|nr:DUF4340 domain-containing protein [Cyclobacteriaceae bacterium]
MSRQKKYNRNLAISFLVLTIVTISYAYYTSLEKSVVDVRAFNVTDLTTVNEVTMKQGERTTTLAFDGTRWNVDGELADRDLIDVLFATLQQVRPVRPVARNLADSILQVLNATGVQVSLRSEGDLQLSFLAGGNFRKSEAYFKRDGDETIYIVVIPGYRVYVSGIFELDKNGWKDRHVFQLNWRNFQRLETSFPESASNDFNVGFSNSYFTIENMAAVDTTKLNDYLDAVSLLSVDEYLDASLMPEDLKEATPFVQITAFDIGGRSHSLYLYTFGPTPDKVYGLINQNQPAYFDKRKLEAVTKGRLFFASKP